MFFRRRRFSAKEKAFIYKIWREVERQPVSLAKKDFEPIYEALVKVILDRLKSERLELDEEQKARLAEEVRNYHITLAFAHCPPTGGLDGYLWPIDRDLLNGWPFKEAKPIAHPK